MFIKLKFLNHINVVVKSGERQRKPNQQQEEMAENEILRQL